VDEENDFVDNTHVSGFGIDTLGGCLSFTVPVRPMGRHAIARARSVSVS
jgi:hypothetical protein